MLNNAEVTYAMTYNSGYTSGLHSLGPPVGSAPASATAADLVRFGQAIRRLETGGLREVASTRVLIAAGRLIVEGLTMRTAAEAAIAGPLTDDVAVNRSLKEMIEVYLTEPSRPDD